MKGEPTLSHFADTHDALGPAAAGDSLCWLVTLDATVIGDCGTAGPVHETGEVEIGYGLAAPYRGHGYGTELVRALSRWLLRQPGVRHVVAQVEPDNAASRATLRRTGFAADGPDRYRRNRAPASRSVDSGPPRLIADERETLLAFVAYLRERVIAKCAGLSDVDARRSAVGSGTSLLWLVKHVTAVEIFWLWHAFAGRDRDVIPDPELTVDDTVESTVAAYRAIVAESERIVRGCPELDRLAVHEPFGPPRRSLRWILVHLVEELARHAGHADILRELADGTVGR